MITIPSQHYLDVVEGRVEPVGVEKGWKNLQPQYMGRLADPDNKRAWAQAGQRASTAKRAENARMRRALNKILDADVTRAEPEMLDVLKDLGIENPTQMDAISVAMVERAKQGNVEAAVFVRDTIGEKPVAGVEVASVADKPIEELDLSTLTLEELEQLALSDAPQQYLPPARTENDDA